MYQPKPPPFNPDVAALAQHVNDELQSVAQSQSDTVDSAQFNVLHVAPKKPRKGMLVVADGSDWDPGSGAGLYLRNEANTAWLFIVSLSALLALANTWTEKQTFSDYTVLGAGPAIKMKKLTGTTNVAEGGSTAVAHGLTQAKIISFQTLVTHSASPAGVVPAGYTANAGYEFSESLYDGYVSIENSATNSANILSKAFTVLITYEE
jgi:hypothetical protein